MNSAMAAIIQFENQVVTKLFHNCESWIGLTADHIQRLQEIQNKCVRRVLAAPLTEPLKEWWNLANADDALNNPAEELVANYLFGLNQTRIYARDLYRMH